MTKKVIRLTESDLRNIIKESLNELNWKTYANAAKKRAKQYDDSDFKDKEKFDKYWELRKMANKKFDDEFVGNLKYDTFGDKWKGKHSPKLDTPNIEPGVTPSGRFSGYNKSGNKLFSPKKGTYYSSNGGYTTPRNFFRDAEVADAYVKANDELWDYYNDEYEYKKGEGWKKKEADIDKIVKESVKRVLNEGIFRDENVDRLIEEFDELKNDAQYWKEVCVVKKDEKESLAILSGVIGKFEEIGQLLAAMNKSAGFATRFNNKYQYVRRRLENCAKALPYLKNIVKYKKSYEAPDWLRLIVNTLTDPAYQVIRESKRRILKEGWNPKPAYALEDEASGAVHMYYSEEDLEEAIEDAKKKRIHGGCYVVRDCRDDSIVFSTDPDVTYKI